MKSAEAPRLRCSRSQHERDWAWQAAGCNTNCFQVFLLLILASCQASFAYKSRADALIARQPTCQAGHCRLLSSTHGLQGDRLGKEEPQHDGHPKSCLYCKQTPQTHRMGTCYTCNMPRVALMTPQLPLSTIMWSDQVPGIPAGGRLPSSPMAAR